MRLYDQFIYFLFIYLIHSNKWILVESSESSATPPASSGGDSSTLNPGQGATSTLPTGGATDSSNKTGVELSLKATAATNEFDYNKDDKVVTYTAKDKYAFKSVKTKKGGCSGCCGTDITIWDAKDAKEYASKVVLDGKGDKNNKLVTVHLANESKKVFTRLGKGKPWQEFDLSKTNPVCIRVNTQSDTCVYTYKKEHKIGTFTPKEGFVFNEVNSGGSVWKATKEDEYANKVEYLALQCVWIYLPNNAEKTFRYAGNNKWVDTQASTQKSTTNGSGGTDQSSGGTTGTGASGGGTESTPASQ